MNFDDISNGMSNEISIPVTNIIGVQKESLVKALENNAYLKVILSFQMEILASLKNIPIDSLNERQKELFEQFFAEEVSKVSGKV